MIKKSIPQKNTILGLVIMLLLCIASIVSAFPPILTTAPATDINGNAATLNATVNPGGSETTAYFEWRKETDTSYMNSTSVQSIGNGTGNVSVSVNINRLATETTYYYRVVAINAGAEESYGSEMSFATTAGTNVSGVISTDTTWTFAESPYIVTGSINVYSSTSEPTLTVDPGVEIRFDGRYSLQIGYSSTFSATLDARGTQTAPIIFTSNKATPAPGDWLGDRCQDIVDNF